MTFPIANISAVVTGAVQAAMAFTVEMLPTDVTRDAVLEAARASVAWFLRVLWSWLVAARAGAVDNFPVAAEAARRAAGSAAEASEPWVEMASKLLVGLYGRLCSWLVAARAGAVDNFPVAAEAARRAAGSAAEASEPWVEMASKLLVGLYGRLCSWLVAARAGAVDNFPVAAEAARRAAGSAVEASEPWVEMASKLLVGLYGRLVTAYADVATATGGRAGQHVLLVVGLLPVVFVCGAVWALTCRTMKGPGLGGARVPRAIFEASPKRYYAAVRTGRRARRGASGTGWKLLLAAAVVAYGAYLATTKKTVD